MNVHLGNNFLAVLNKDLASICILYYTNIYFLNRLRIYKKKLFNVVRLCELLTQKKNFYS